MTDSFYSDDAVQASLPSDAVLPDFGPQKAWVALVVATVLSALSGGLAFATDGSTLFTVLTIVSLALTPLATALGVYQTTNRATSKRLSK